MQFLITAFLVFSALLQGQTSSPEVHYKQALALRDKGQLAKAIEEMRRALSLRPAWDDAQLALGLILQSAGDGKAAMAQYRAVLKRSPKSAEAHNWLGVAYMASNDLAAAADEFRVAIKLKPDYARAYNNLGTTLAQAGDVQQGIATLQSGLKIAPSDLQLNLNLGTALRTAGDSDGAIKQFQTVLKLSPDDPEVHQQLGLALRQKGELEPAIAEFESALQLNPEYQDGYYALAQTLRQWAASTGHKNSEAADARNSAGLQQTRARNLAAAIENFRAAISIDPNHAEAHYNLGAALWYSDSKAAAVHEFDESIRLNPAGDAYSLRSLAYRESGDLRAALRMAQRAIALNPRVAVGYFDAGLLLLRLGQREPALGLFEAGLNLPGPAPDLELAIKELQSNLAATDSAEGRNILGRLLGLAGVDSKMVISQFEAALKLQPEYAEAHNNIGLVYTQLNEDEKAIGAFREAIRIRPDFADAHSNLGAILTSTDVKTAVAELEKAVALQPALLKAQFNLALAYGAHPDYGVTRQIEVVRELLGTSPNYPRADYILGKALLQKGEVAEGARHLEQAIQLEPQYGEAHYQLGLALARLGKRDESAAELKKGRELIAAAQNPPRSNDRERFESMIREGKFAEVQPLLESYTATHAQDAWAWYALGYAYFGQQKVGDSIKALAKSLALDITNADAHKVLGRNLMIIGRFEEARVEFEQGAKYDPKSAELRYNLGKLFSIQDQWPQARQNFELALKLDPNYMEAYDGLGFALEALGDDAGAILNYERAVRLNDERKAGFAAPFVNLSALYNRSADTAKALQYARRSIQVNPNSDRGWFQLGKALERSGELDQAIDALKRATELNARASSYYYVLGTLYRRVGKQVESRAAMEQFAKLDRESSSLDQKRRDTLRQQGAVRD